MNSPGAWELLLLLFFVLLLVLFVGGVAWVVKRVSKTPQKR